MSAPVSAAPRTSPVVSQPDEILRFRMSERQMHWAVAMPFMVCYLTAIILVTIYNPDPHRPFRAVVSWTHRVSGVCLFVLPVSVMFRHWYDIAIHVQNIGEVWRWTLADLRWLFVMGPAMLSKKIVLPEQGKFNAAEKINFMVLTATVPLYICTGLLIWTHQFAFAAWVLHFAMATMATPLMFGHIFMATVNPDTRVGLSGMMTGFVDRHWASHHYTSWYKENFPHHVTHPAAGPETVPAQDPVVERDMMPVAHESPWSGQFEPAMASGYGADRAPASSGARTSGSDHWEHEPLPPFMTPIQVFDRARSRRPPLAASIDTVPRPDAELTT